MKIIEWIALGMSCIAIIKTFGDIRKGGIKRRGNFVFMAIMTAAIALTFLAGFSQVHLFWILPVAAVLRFGIIVWQSWTQAQRQHVKMEREIHEAAAKVPPLKISPFGTLKWNGMESWEGEVCLPAWAGFQSRGGPYGSEDSENPSDGTATILVTPNNSATPPSESQQQALQFQIERGGEVVNSISTALTQYYKDLRESWKSYAPDMPEVPQNPAAFRNMIGLHQIHVHPYEKDGMAYVGLEFGCDWDEEHGFGVMLHGSRGVEIGSADTSFAGQPDEAKSVA